MCVVAIAEVAAFDVVVILLLMGSRDAREALRPTVFNGFKDALRAWRTCEDDAERAIALIAIGCWLLRPFFAMGIIAVLLAPWSAVIGMCVNWVPELKLLAQMLQDLYRFLNGLGP